MTVPLRAAIYLRVSTARQAEHDVSIPDQKRQGCQWRAEFPQLWRSKIPQFGGWGDQPSC